MRIFVADIFDEVEEDLRADRAQRLLKKYGFVLVAAACLVVVGAGGWQAWQWYDAKRNAGFARDYLAAQHIADTTKGAGRQAALAGFAGVADAAGAGYRTLARLQEAALKAEAGDLDAASALWDQVANDSAADPLLRDVANLQWATHHIDTGAPETVAARLVPLAAAAAPFRALAQEAQAMLDLRQGHADSARATLRQLAQDATAPEGVRRRADGILERLGG
jgi:hypothetical protein